jgi:hypothetical protein
MNREQMLAEIVEAWRKSDQAAEFVSGHFMGKPIGDLSIPELLYALCTASMERDMWKTELCYRSAVKGEE